MQSAIMIPKALSMEAKQDHGDDADDELPVKISPELWKSFPMMQNRLDQYNEALLTQLNSTTGAKRSRHQMEFTAGGSVNHTSAADTAKRRKLVEDGNVKYAIKSFDIDLEMPAVNDFGTLRLNILYGNTDKIWMNHVALRFMVSCLQNNKRVILLLNDMLQQCIANPKTKALFDKGSATSHSDRHQWVADFAAQTSVAKKDMDVVHELAWRSFNDPEDYPTRQIVFNAVQMLLLVEMLAEGQPDSGVKECAILVARLIQVMGFPDITRDAYAYQASDRTFHHTTMDALVGHGSMFDLVVNEFPPRWLQNHANELPREWSMAL